MKGGRSAAASHTVGGAAVGAEPLFKHRDVSTQRGYPVAVQAIEDVFAFVSVEHRFTNGHERFDSGRVGHSSALRGEHLQASRRIRPMCAHRPRDASQSTYRSVDGDSARFLILYRLPADRHT